MQTNPAACKRAAPPHRREGNLKRDALPATAGCEGRLGKYCEHSEGESILAVSWGMVAKSADARNPDTAVFILLDLFIPVTSPPLVRPILRAVFKNDK